MSWANTGLKIQIQIMPLSDFDEHPTNNTGACSKEGAIDFFIFYLYFAILRGGVVHMLFANS